MKILLRGYHPQLVSGKTKYIDYLYSHEKTKNIFHNWNPLNYLHPKSTYLLRGFDLYTLYRIKVFLYLLWVRLTSAVAGEVVIDSQENVFLIDLVKRLGFSDVTLVFYDFASKDRNVSDSDKRQIKKARSIVVMTEVVKQEIINKIPEIEPSKVVVRAYKVDGAIFRPFLDREKLECTKTNHLDFPYILYVGSEQTRKNLFAVVGSFKELLKTMPELHFIKLGKDQDVANRLKLNRLLESDPALRSGFTLIEEFSDGDLAGYYNCAAVFVFPSLYEGFGIPLVEAMACGVPVVASDIPTTREICADAAVYVQGTNNPQEFSRLITQIMQGRGLSQQLVRKGLERAKRFTYQSPKVD